MTAPIADRVLAEEALWLAEHPEELARRRVSFPGFMLLDRYLAPMVGELILVGAEQGSGKTTFVDTLCRLAAQTGKRSLRFILEDSAIETRFRVLSTYVGVPAHLLKAGVHGVPMPEIAKRLEDARSLPMTWVEHEHNLERIVEAIESESEGLDIVTIDYLQVLEGHGAQDRRNQVRMMIAELQAIARSKSILLIVASQIVRPESRKVGERPTRHHLKEAGDIADAADKIVLLWRDQDAEHTPTNIRIDKDKSGVGSGREWKLNLDMRTTQFVEVGSAE